jgi:hypothetical protein
MAAKKEPFGGKQAPAFGQGKKEQQNAKPKAGDKGRERQETTEKKKRVK